MRPFCLLRASRRQQQQQSAAANSVATERRRLSIRSIALSRSTPTPPTSPSQAAAPPNTLTPEQHQFYATQGYLVIPNFFSRSDLSALATELRRVARERGSRYVPESDRQHMPNYVEIQTEVKQALPPDQQNVVGEQGQQRVEFVRKERKVKVRCRNQQEIERAYNKIVDLRQKYAAYKGVSPAQRQQYLQQQQQQQQQEQQQKMQQQQPSSASPTTVPPPTPGSEAAGMRFSLGGQERFRAAPSDDIDVNSFGQEEARRSYDRYQKSGRMEKDIRDGAHLDDAMAHVHNCANAWAHVLPSESKVRSLVFAPRGPQEQSGTSASIASSLGDVAAQLACVMTTRLYSDTLLQRVMFSNSIPFHLDASGINYRDPRGLMATVVLPGSSQPLDEHHGGFVVLPGSHRIVQHLTNDGHDMASFLKPAAWELGEALRGHPELLRIQPKSLGVLPEGTLLLTNNMLLYSNHANMGVEASSYALDAVLTGAGRRDGPVSQLDKLLNDVPLTYSFSVMPDGATFDGGRNTWMSKDTHGPLYRYAKGAPLRDSEVFPVLHSEVDLSE